MSFGTRINEESRFNYKLVNDIKWFPNLAAHQDTLGNTKIKASEKSLSIES